MSNKIAAPAPSAHPSTTRSWCDWLAADLVPAAARAVADIRDCDPADVLGALAEVPDERRDDLILLLAAMVDPDRSLAELLAWTVGTVRSRDGAQERRSFTGDYVPCPDCGRRTRFDNLAGHRGGRQCHLEKRAEKRPVDPVAVDERAAGRDVKLTTAELDAVVADLTDRGLSSEDIAQRLRVARRTVVRSRARIRAQDDRLDRLIDAGVSPDAATVLAARQRVA